MKSRMYVLAIALVSAILLTPAVASAWSNGIAGPDEFGTHDWVLYEAIKLSGASWIDTPTALAATDDPDYTPGEVDKTDHMFMQSGAYRGGPERAAQLYEQVYAAYWSGDYLNASKYLGLLSHYYSDLAVPFHSMGGIPDTALHLQYELDVDKVLDAPEKNAEWVVGWKRSPIEDVREAAIQVAYCSRATYWSLATQYTAFGFDYGVEAMTKTSLNRSVNDLADIILAVSDGMTGYRRASVSAGVSSRYPSTSGPVSASAYCRDDSGLPLEGIGVQFTWSYPSGPVTSLVYSGADGIARSYADESKLVLGRRVDVRVSLRSGLTATSTSASSWFVPTEPIGYMKTSVSSPYPTQGSSVRVQTVVLNREGKPISNLPVKFLWRHRTGTISRSAITDWQGVATSTRDIGGAKKYYRVKVEAVAPSAGSERTASSSFVPSDSFASIEATSSDYYPARNTRVRTYATCLDSAGRPVEGVPVTFVWRFRTVTYQATAITGPSGRASVSKDIEKATRGYVVHVSASAKSGGTTRTAMTWFTPR